MTAASGRTSRGALGTLPPLTDHPLVSVVIPAYNEEQHIGRLLESLEEQTYAGEHLEVLVADGGSSDRTREIVLEHARHSRLSHVVLIDNPARTTAAGLNAGVAGSGGEVVVILGAHSAVAPDFVEENIRALRETGAAAVGGPLRTEGEGTMASAIAAALSHPFGVGDARFRFATAPAYVDTVAFAAYRRQCFEVLGGFDGGRDKGEDDHFNYRIRAAGGLLYLTPRIRSTYYSRRGLGALARQYLGYGKAKGRALIEEPGSIRPRHLAPSLAVVIGAVLAAFALWSFAARAALAVLAAVYVALAAAAAWRANARDRRLAPLTMLAFPVMHASYGAGLLVGATRFVLRRPR
jgi:glycosyltransferase involved in cell wall biosynthesis